MKKKLEIRTAVSMKLLVYAQENGITQAQLARRLNLSRQNLSLYLSRKRTPPVDALQRIRELLQLESIDVLISVNKVCHS